ncbi:MAG: twin-arginine translocase subunit TatC [Candidatus Eiseniibacteriota bacterium]
MSEWPALGPPEGAVAAGQSGRPPRTESEREGAEAARRDLADAGVRGEAAESDESDSGPTLAMSFLEHLEELRIRLLRSVIAILLCAAIGWWISAPALEWAIRHTVGHVVVLDPIESFSERFKLSLILGALAALPIVLYQAWAFVLPGLFRRERRLLLPLVFGSLVLFVAGAATAVGLVVPLVLDVLSRFLTPSMRQDIRLSSLLGFIYNLALATGAVFQLPLVAGALAALRIVSSRFLLKQWRLAIVATLVLSALITPGDVVTAQIILGLPLVLLYLLSIGVAWTIERMRRDADSDPVEGASA